MQTASRTNKNEHFPFTGQREAEHRKCKRLTYYCIYILRTTDTYNQIYRQRSVLITEYKGTPTYFGYYL
jgi:hypothetical protein